MPTEREAVLRERRAFLSGVGRTLTETHAKLAAAEYYPLPKVTRPRVVTDSGAGLIARETSWRVVGGALQWKTGSEWNNLAGPMNEGMFITAQRVRILADLLANPTEEAEDDS